MLSEIIIQGSSGELQRLVALFLFDFETIEKLLYINGQLHPSRRLLEQALGTNFAPESPRGIFQTELMY